MDEFEKIALEQGHKMKAALDLLESKRHLLQPDVLEEINRLLSTDIRLSCGKENWVRCSKIARIRDDNKILRAENKALQKSLQQERDRLEEKIRTAPVPRGSIIYYRSRHLSIKEQERIWREVRHACGHTKFSIFFLTEGANVFLIHDGQHPHVFAIRKDKLESVPRDALERALAVHLIKDMAK